MYQFHRMSPGLFDQTHTCCEINCVSPMWHPTLSESLSVEKLGLSAVVQDWMQKKALLAFCSCANVIWAQDHNPGCNQFAGPFLWKSNDSKCDGLTFFFYLFFFVHSFSTANLCLFCWKLFDGFAADSIALQQTCTACFAANLYCFLCSVQCA